MNESLHMLEMHFDSRRLFQLAARPALMHRTFDLGYLVHCALREVFEHAAPSPFALMESQAARLPVLGYAGVSALELTNGNLRRRALAESLGLDWDSLRSKGMPNGFRQGQQLRFHVRACPVIRKSRGSQAYRFGAELDVFLAEVERAGKEVLLDRQTVYARWLESQITRSKAAACQSVHLISMQMTEFLRRDANREIRSIARPDVTFDGSLRVIEPDLFFALVRRGIGRHRAFGFGMMLLRRA